LECRCQDGEWKGSSPSLGFYGHALNLERGEDFLFKNLDGTMRRGIRKAEAAGLRIKIDDTAESVHTYYALHCQTRRRHGLPPQPSRFFLNIQRHIMQAGHGFVVTARLDEKPVAAAMFFHWGGHALYKFGASDYGCQQLRPNNLVMWHGIRQCAARGARRLHFGRTSLTNEGLRRFKLSFGAEEQEIKYARYDFKAGRFVKDVDRAQGWMNKVFGSLPPPLLRWAGELLYPHAG
jgi:lipid II:glycine glycyltransferase (peptidoglycan interpeptide bridge formation enzyme)